MNLRRKKMNEIKDTFLGTAKETITIDKTHYERLKFGHARYKKASEILSRDLAMEMGTEPEEELRDALQEALKETP
jgi:hypothetical protein